MKQSATQVIEVINKLLMVYHQTGVPGSSPGASESLTSDDTLKRISEVLSDYQATRPNIVPRQGPRVPIGT